MLCAFASMDFLIAEHGVIYFELKDNLTDSHWYTGETGDINNKNWRFIKLLSQVNKSVNLF